MTAVVVDHKSNMESRIDSRDETGAALDVDFTDNYLQTRAAVGYVERENATFETYTALGFMSGLEIHQQLLTDKKLFCNCPAGIYQADGEYDAEVIRHMRPTLSEMGEYDGTALMERKTRKNIIYRIKDETACTYDIDDTPPFPLNRQALGIAIEVGLLLGVNIVGELHITRKQYLDGSIPTGFQRTGIVGIEGEIPITARKIRIIQLSVEEDACREVSDVGHWRTYTTDRLGMPLIETVTYPDMKTPDEVAEACHYLRFLARSTGKVRTGIGAAREDVNVSISGGTRVEIKGVSHIKWIPDLTHTEAFRQKALLRIKKILEKRVSEPQGWQLTVAELAPDEIRETLRALATDDHSLQRVVAVNLPHLRGILSHFTQPGQTFADEISGRLKVIACLERPNLIHSEPVAECPHTFGIDSGELKRLRQKLKSGDDDAQLILWGSPEDVGTAIETIEERCRLAFDGVPNETRKSFADGTTVFERVLPGPDRMYPDTDSAPIPIEQELIDDIGSGLPMPVADRMEQFRKWKIPVDTHTYLLKNNLAGLIDRIAREFEVEPIFIGTLLGHDLKRLEGRRINARFNRHRVYEMFAFLNKEGLHPELALRLLPAAYERPEESFDSLLNDSGFHRASTDDILAEIPAMCERFVNSSNERQEKICVDWLVGRLREKAMGNIRLSDLRKHVEKVVKHG